MDLLREINRCALGSLNWTLLGTHRGLKHTCTINSDGYRSGYSGVQPDFSLFLVLEERSVGTRFEANCSGTAVSHLTPAPFHQRTKEAAEGKTTHRPTSSFELLDRSTKFKLALAAYLATAAASLKLHSSGGAKQMVVPIQGEF
jgi:hypothetical protein